MMIECTPEIQSWIDLATKLAPAFAVLIVGLFSTYIGFNQYQTNRNKLRLDLFEKRLEAYEKLQEYFNCVCREGHVEDTMFSILAEARYKSAFLFGDEISEHIDEVWDKARRMGRLRLELYSSKHKLNEEERNEEERQKIVDEHSELFQWTLDQQKDSPKLYAKYLRIIE